MSTMQSSSDPFTEAEAAEIVEAASNIYSGQEGPEPTKSIANSISYGQLCQRHPSYKPDYWRKLRALYAGGEELFGDAKLLRDLFPRHRDESETVYQERLKRSWYIPYAGEIIDHIVAALFRQPVTMQVDVQTESEEELPDWYKTWLKDVSPPGGRTVPFNSLLREQVLTAFKLRCAWTLVDLPAMIDDEGAPVVFSDRYAQEDAGGLAAYAVAVEPESVVDWEEDSAGNLLWVLIWTCECKRMNLFDNRNEVVQQWTYYDRVHWERYELRHDKDIVPKERTPVPMVAAGVHTFGRVPLERFELPDGLWAMAKLEGPAREHLNKRCALSWGEIQTLLPELYEFLGPEEGGIMPISENQENSARALSQTRGQGYVQVRGAADKAEFIGPDSAPFTHVMKSCDNVRDEMHRITHQMALSVDNSAAALGRSGDSKAQDKAATGVILTAVGILVRLHAEAILNLVSLARGDSELIGIWSASGMEKFDGVQVSDAIKEAIDIDLLGIESPTFRRLHRFSVCRLILGDDATVDDLDSIKEELEKNIPDEVPTPAEVSSMMTQEVTDMTAEQPTAPKSPAIEK